MAELNFGLLTPPGSQSIGNAFVQGMDQAAVARAQENQNALSQYTLSKAKREDELNTQLLGYTLSKAKREDELNTQLLGDLRNATTNDEIYRAYQRAGKGDVASKLRGEQLTQDKTRLEIAGMPATQANTKAQTAVRHGTVMKNEATRVLADPTLDNAMRAVVNFGRATGQDVTQELAAITAMGNDPVKIANWAKGHAVTGEQLLNQSVVKTVDTDMGGSISRQTYNAQGVAVGAPIILPKTPTPGSVPGIAQAATAAAIARDQGVDVPGAAPAPVTPTAAPAQPGTQVTPAAFPRITPQVQATRNAQQIAILNAELVNSNPADQQRIRAEIAKLSTGDPFAAAGANPSPVVNNMPGAVAATAAPAVSNALIERSPKDQRDAKVVTSTTTDSAGNIRRFNKFGEQIGEVIKGAGKPSATYEKTQALQKQLSKDLGFAIIQLTDITKDGGLIDQSTGSGAGRLVDLAAGFGGKAMPGAIAAGKIAPIADLALKVIPRFEGPQSNADTKSYKEAAGQLADSSLPNQIRKEAGRVVLRLMQERKNQFVTSDMATEGAPAASGVVDFGSLK